MRARNDDEPWTSHRSLSDPPPPSKALARGRKPKRWWCQRNAVATACESATQFAGPALEVIRLLFRPRHVWEPLLAAKSTGQPAATGAPQYTRPVVATTPVAPPDSPSRTLTTTTTTTTILQINPCGCQCVRYEIYALLSADDRIALLRMRTACERTRRGN